MIYLTVGTFPAGFDRLVMAVDELCLQHNVDCVAQISDGSYTPKNMNYKRFYSAEEQEKNIRNSKFVITHGGLGIIGDIMRQEKPLLVFPRLPNEAAHDQRPASKKLAEIYDFPLCLKVSDFNNIFFSMLNAPYDSVSYNLKNDIPQIISDYLIRI